MPDLCGYDETEKPPAGYDKRTIIGHDRGARVATRFAKDYPDVITHLGVFDNVPTRVIFEKIDATIARCHWFFTFNQTPTCPKP